MLKKLKFFLKKKQIMHLGRNVEIANDIILGTPQKMRIESNTRIGKKSRIFGYGHFTLSEGSVIGPAFTAYTTSHNYTTNDYLPYGFQDLHQDITIGKNVWIGGNVTITKGITIGEGAIILAGSVLPKDIPPFAIVEGNPFRIVKFRDKKEYQK